MGDGEQAFGPETGGEHLHELGRGRSGDPVDGDEAAALGCHEQQLLRSVLPVLDRLGLGTLVLRPVLGVVPVTDRELLERGAGVEADTAVRVEHREASAPTEEVALVGGREPVAADPRHRIGFAGHVEDRVGQ